MNDKRTAEKAAMWDALMEMCGHWQDGSQATVKLWQDDATRTAGITVDPGTGSRNEKRYYVERGDFEAAIRQYVKENDL